MGDYKKIESDVLIIGGGGAGLRAAVAASCHDVDVVVLSKGLIGRSGTTPNAGSSFQAALAYTDHRDSPEIHFNDTWEMGRHLGDRTLIRALAQESPERALDLDRYGVRFRKAGDKFLQMQHPGQSYPRNLVAQGGGYGLMVGLLKELRRHENVRLLDDHIVTSLINLDGRVIGAVGLDVQTGAPTVFTSKATVIATGGYEKLWARTDTGPDCTGEGLSLALRVGAVLVDLEMVLYYPVVILYPEQARGLGLQYESLLAEKYVGAKLLNSKDEEFLPEGALPTRDVLTRLIFEEIEKGNAGPCGGVYIDVTRSSRSPSEIDTYLAVSSRSKNLLDLGIDVRKVRIEAAPAIHYTLGGIKINERTETNLPGLYAAGEVSGNVHGANRISGNALAETQVFGARAGNFAAQWAKECEYDPDIVSAHVDSQVREVHSVAGANVFGSKKNGLSPHHLKRQVQQIADYYVGWQRSEKSLLTAIEHVRQMREEELPRLEVSGPRSFNTPWREALEIPGMLDLLEAVATAALHRKESRGHHRRTDMPETRADMERHTAVVLANGGLQSFYSEID